MRTHEHALISLGYAGAVALLAGEGLADPRIYLAALIGGEIIDFVDQPFYFLVYGRNDPQVVKARQLLKEEGLKSTIAYLNEVENRRGLVRLLLHNVYTLTLAALVGIVLSLFLPASIYLFVFWGALLLHMFADMYGNFKILGQADNWLWVLPGAVLKRWGQLGSRLVYGVALWIAIVQLGFLLVTLRWGWQLASPSAYFGLYAEVWRVGNSWLTYAPLLVLVLYLLFLIIVCIAAVHKYGLELGQDGHPKAIPFSLGSLRVLAQFVSGRLRRNRQSFERVLLRMQADQATWIALLAILIASTLLGLTWLHFDSDLLLFLVPIILALLFGTFLHSTIGELGGALGVVLAWFLNLLVARLGLQTLWPASRGYLLFGAAFLAWLWGLLGHVFLKGLVRMSLVTFIIQLRPEDYSSDNTKWLRTVADWANEGLQTGYASAHSQLFGDPGKCEFMSSLPVDLLLAPLEGQPVLDADHYHLQAIDNCAGILRQMAYVLCDNRLMSRSEVVGPLGLLPVMPRHRSMGTDSTNADMYLQNSIYYWGSKRRKLAIQGTMPTTTDPAEPHQLLTKVWGEFIDQMVNRNTAFRTDLLIYPGSEEMDAITICGITREVTTTHELASVESEAYAGAVMRAILSCVQGNPGLKLVRHTSARLLYPRVSIYDQDLVEGAMTSALLPVDDGTISKQDLKLIRQSLNLVTSEKVLPGAAAHLGKQFVFWALQVVVTGLVARLLGLR